MSELEEREPQTEAEARRIIEQITFSLGFIDVDDEAQLRNTSAEYQRKTRKNAELTRKRLARSISVFASELYSNKFRFMYEMIQNADDARYNRAHNADQDPFIRFTLLDSGILVETNEDGFSTRNVRAICDIGDSSKKEEADSIGEKGLGFKSVFGVASNVLIQSGIWSFRFEHNADDDGLGMITPHWEPRHQILEPPMLTRFHLTYNEDIRQSLDSLIAEFEKLPPTTTFFLKNIHTIELVINTKSRSVQKTFHRGNALNSPITSIAITTDGVKEKRTFQTISMDIGHMPIEKKRQGQQTSRITLGFPVSNDGQSPLLESKGQHVFAYLPFLIQADFVTSASRESIIDCPWNQRLLKGVAETFLNAVRSFVQQRSGLAYTWMRYFPTDPIPGFWEPLARETLALVSRTAVLIRAKGSEPKNPSYIADLRALRPIFLDGDGEPLFDDLPNKNIFLSPHYKASDINILQKHLGLKSISYNEMLERFKADLRETYSRFKTADFSGPWYIAALDLIVELFQETSTRPKMKELSFIPLKTATWVTPPDRDLHTFVHFHKPEDDPGVPDLPSDLNLQILKPEACPTPEHRQAYIGLGISDWDPKLVMDLILAGRPTQSVRMVYDVVADLQILYWFGCELTELQSRSLGIATSQCKLKTPSEVIYFITDAEFDASKLLCKTETTKWSSICGFLHEAYMSPSLKDQYRNGLTWMAWLEDIMHIRYYPALARPNDDTKMSRELTLVLHDNPSKFIDNLKEHWESEYKFAYNRNFSIQNDIKQCAVPLRDGGKCQLPNGFLPTPDLMRKVCEFGLENSFPFVQTAAAEATHYWREWLFLEELGLCGQINLRFYLQVIVQLKRQFENETTRFDHFSARIVNAYKGIGEVSSFTSRTQIQEHFRSNMTIFAPAAAKKWCGPVDCVWDGPSYMRTKTVLKNIYGRFREIENLFVNDLGIRNFSVDDLLNELVSLQASRLDQAISQTDTAVRIYDELHAMTVNKGMDEFEAVRNRFRDHKLVLVNRRWYSPSSCIWNAPVNIPDRPSIQTIYPNLKAFFVDRLGVETIRVELLIDQIVRLSRRDSPEIGSVKENLRALSMMLVNEDSLFDLRTTPRWKKLQEGRFLPVRSLNGTIQLASISDEFFIVDNKRFEDAFEGKLKMLDFSVEDLMTLDTLFRALPITSRYLSNQVRTETVIAQCTPHDDLTRDLQQRSYALSCCAIACHSWKYADRRDEIHRLLLASRVLVSSNLRTSLIVNTREGNATAQSDRVLGKVERTSESLTFYVPQEQEAQRSCYRSYLPLELAKLFELGNFGADRKIYRILIEPVGRLNSVMKEEDIPQVEWIEKHPSLLQLPAFDQTVNDAAATTATAANGQPLDTSEVVISSSTFAFTFSATSQATQPQYPDRPTSSAASLSTERTPTPSLDPFPTFDLELGREQYGALLKKLIQLARGAGHDRPNHIFDMSSLRNSLPSQYNSISAMFGIHGSARANPAITNRIGAAGELFAFETFRAKGLPTFTEDNWQSRIRHYVSIVPEYAHLEAWSSPEIADIMYEDRGGHMRALFEAFSIDGVPAWLAPAATETIETASVPAAPMPGPIKYRLEVKTTEGPCDHPFYMSRHQFKQMRQCAVGSTRPTEVYVIVRVFNLGREDVGIRLFVDPWRLWDTKLRFESDTLAVVSATDDLGP